MKKICILDYGLGNIKSLYNAIKEIGYQPNFFSEGKYKFYDHVFIPGVGSYLKGSKLLKNPKILNFLKESRKDSNILGICLGMQLLGKHSEEGKLMGLNLINANTIKINLNKNSNLKIPHMGWNYIKNSKKNRLISNLPENPRFYFTHSYHLGDIDKKNVVSTVDHGIELVAIINHNNIFGTQFHPEKSHKYGLALLKNFGELNA